MIFRLQGFRVIDEPKETDYFWIRKWMVSSEPHLKRLFARKDCCYARMDRDARVKEILFGERDERVFSYMTNTMLGGRLAKMASSHAGSLIVVESTEADVARELGFPVTNDRKSVCFCLSRKNKNG